MNHSKKTASGFTLIELMVTVALAAILMMVAVPSFTAFARNSQLSSFTNSLLAAINAARGEAMKRGRYALVVPVDGASWDSGWVVYVPVNRTLSYGQTTDITILKSDPKPSYLTITGNGNANDTPPYIMFDASGYSRTKSSGFSGNLTLEIKRNDTSSADASAQTRRLKIATTGRARVCTPTSSSDSNCGDTTTTSF
jgi:type IV fimbrial biogenesis protein FimT